MKIPEPTLTIGKLIDDYHEKQSAQKPPRPHLGGSLLGHHCSRWMWLSFRWAITQKHPGRIVRLFRRGENEEMVIVNDMRAVGIDIRKTSERTRIKVDLAPHVGGTLDGMIESGVPAAPNKRHVAEFKTHNFDSFARLKKEGVEKSHFTHYIQMQVYMHGAKVDRALYFAVCKDNDETYEERVRYDKDIAEKYIERGRQIALADEMPAPISNDPSWYQCKMCPAHSFCHETKLTKNVNCRTCAHSTAKEDGTWRCERYDSDGIPVEFQLNGCDSHVLHPNLVPWERKETGDRWNATYIIEGKEVVNGDPDAHIYGSKEIIAAPKTCASNDENLYNFRETFGARIVG